MSSSESNERLLESVFGLSGQLGKVPFSTVVKLSTGYDVIPINLEEPSDKALINTLVSIFKGFQKTSTSTRSRYQGDRINEVGRRIEDALVHEMNKQPLTVKKLPNTGYPDIEIFQSNTITYLEMKTSSVKEKSSFRYFYYTSGKKIRASAKHILLSITATQESPRYWKIDSWVLSDLSKLNVRLKSEFNASKRDLMDEKSQIIASV